MNIIAELQARLKGRSDSEHEQAILRIVLLGLITIYMWGRATASPATIGEQDQLLLTGLVGFFAMAIGFLVAIWIWPAANVARRVLGMVADVGVTTFALFLSGASGVGLVGLYLFFIFGNGFRYGRRYLLLCTGLSLAGFMSVTFAAPWWRDEPIIGWGLMVSMLVLPLYVSTLLMRIQSERVKAEQALRDCVERQQRGS
jgi:two-component system sensor histidine kinase RpfC